MDCTIHQIFCSQHMRALNMVSVQIVWRTLSPVIKCLIQKFWIRVHPLFHGVCTRKKPNLNSSGDYLIRSSEYMIVYRDFHST